MKIMVFDPRHYLNNFNNYFRGEILFQKILENIPSDEKRKRKIAKNILIAEKSKDNDDSSNVWNIIEELASEGNTEIDDYVSSHDIQLVKIDKEFLEKELLKNPSV